MDGSWIGGEHHFNGQHDVLCFFCGIEGESVPCQTCTRSYHPQCIEPPLDLESVPSIWFCPVCIERQWHIPPPDSAPATNQPITLDSVVPWGQSNDGEKETDVFFNTGISRDKTPSSGESKEPQNCITESPFDEARNAFQNLTSAEEPPTSRPIQQKPSTRASKYSEAPIASRNNKNQQSRNLSQRKRFKYSQFSPEVDKALSVIHSELEKAASSASSQEALKAKVQTLEQKMKVQEGNILLSRQELVGTRKELASERSMTVRYTRDLATLRDEIIELKAVAQKKDDEMQRWQGMLRTMLGTESEPGGGESKDVNSAD